MADVMPSVSTSEPTHADPSPQTVPPLAPPSQVPVEEDEKFFAAVGYFAFLFVIPLIVKPKSPYCKFHAKQSMVLFLITILVFMVLFAIPLVGSLLTLALFAVYILAIYRSYKGEWWNIPLISNLTGKINLETLYGKTGATLANLSSGLKETASGVAQKATDTLKAAGKQDEGSEEGASESNQTPPPPPSPPPAPSASAPAPAPAPPQG